MWIICENGQALNTDLVARFRMDGDIVIADVPGLAVQNQMVGKVDVKDLVGIATTGIQWWEVKSSDRK